MDFKAKNLFFSKQKEIQLNDDRIKGEGQRKEN